MRDRARTRDLPGDEGRSGRELARGTVVEKDDRRVPTPRPARPSRVGQDAGRPAGGVHLIAKDGRPRGPRQSEGCATATWRKTAQILFPSGSRT